MGRGEEKKSGLEQPRVAQLLFQDAVFFSREWQKKPILSSFAQLNTFLVSEKEEVAEQRYSDWLRIPQQRFLARNPHEKWMDRLAPVGNSQFFFLLVMVKSSSLMGEVDEFLPPPPLWEFRPVSMFHHKKSIGRILLSLGIPTCFGSGSPWLEMAGSVCPSSLGIRHQ